jgi:sister chromatid cohesion protein PDS5
LAQRWYTLCFLAAFEPNDAFKDKMIRWLKNRAEHYRTVSDLISYLCVGAIKHLVMEKTFPRLLHLLAHHTDFSTMESDLDDMVNYLTFYLDCVGMADNYALFFHLAQRVKQARDALEPDKSEVYLFFL